MCFAPPALRPVVNVRAYPVVPPFSPLHLPLSPSCFLRLSTSPLLLCVMGSKKKRLCLCSKCRKLKRQEGEDPDLPGRMIELREYNRHAADDELRAEEADHLFYSTVVATMVNNRDPDALPTRPRDVEAESAPLSGPSHPSGSPVRFKLEKRPRQPLILCL